MLFAQQSSNGDHSLEKWNVAEDEDNGRFVSGMMWYDDTNVRFRGTSICWTEFLSTRRVAFDCRRRWQNDSHTNTHVHSRQDVERYKHKAIQTLLHYSSPISFLFNSQFFRSFSTQLYFFVFCFVRRINERVHWIHPKDFVWNSSSLYSLRPSLWRTLERFFVKCSVHFPIAWNVCDAMLIGEAATHQKSHFIRFWHEMYSHLR